MLMEVKEKFIIEICQTKTYYQETVDEKGIRTTDQKELAKSYDSYGDAKNAAIEIMSLVYFKAFSIEKFFLIEQPAASSQE